MLRYPYNQVHFRRMIEEPSNNGQSFIFSGLEVTGCGSYRRGKQTCGDLDVLVTHEDEDALDELFERILAKLREIGFLTDDLTVQRDGNQQVI